MIVVEVHAPIRCKGKYSFGNYSEFYKWMTANFKRPASLKASALLSLAERGQFEISMYGLDVESSCDKPLGYSAKELARETRFLKTRMGDDAGFDLKKAQDYLEKLAQLSEPPSA